MITVRPKLLIFDVNETLLDLAPLKLSVNKALKSDAAFDIWFQTLLHYSLVETLTDSYQNFGTIAEAVLKMVAFKLRIELSAAEIASTLGKSKELPPHSDVPEALRILKKSGFILVAFSNGSETVLNRQLQFAKIGHFFDAIISVEDIRQFKPKATSYRYVIAKMKTPTAEAMMIAAHGWDILGAKRAGLKTAFVERDGKATYPLAKAPDITGKTILEVAQELMAI